MKSKLLFFVFALLLIMGLSACSKNNEPQYEVIENHAISVCGVADPLNNFEWLTQFIAYNSDLGYDLSIQLYENSETKTSYIVALYAVSAFDDADTSPSIGVYSSRQVYACSGERLFVDSCGITNADEWNHFFNSGTNQLQGIIWSRKRTS